MSVTNPSPSPSDVLTEALAAFGVNGERWHPRATAQGDCALTAIMGTCAPTQTQRHAARLLRAAIGGRDIPRWNDRQRGFSAVHDAFKRAIEAGLREEQKAVRKQPRAAKRAAARPA